MEQVKNEKTFFEVFPTLRADGELKMLFQDVEVKKITTNSTREFLHIHMVSHHLIPKKVIWKMEQSIKEQLFGTASVAIQIEEFYVLSELYTLETLLAEYKESLVLELEKKSVLAASMFEQAELHFEGEKIVCVELLDSIVSEGKKEYIVTLLEEVLSRRFGMQAEIRVLYREQEENQSREYDEQRIQQEINAIFERRARQKGEILQKPISERQTDSAKEKKTADSGKKESAKSGFKKGEFRKKEFQRPLKQGDDPSLVYGKNFEDEPLTLDQVVTEMGEITIHGKIISFDTREIRNEKTILMFSVTDFTDTITVKMFVRNDQLAELLGDIKKGAFVKIKGVTTIDKFDGELTIGSVTGIKKIGDFTVSREDLSPVKRVELHCHTKMSDMDGVSEVKSIVKRAHDWGHPAIAITDHGVAQSFPDANHYIETLDKDDPFKVIYGVEGYVVDDLTEIAVNAGEQTLDDTYIVFDIETTGFYAIKDKIIEIGAVKVKDGAIVEKFSTFVNPKRPIPFEITQLTSITDEMVLDAPDIESVLPEFLEFVGDGVLVAHNAGFDVGFKELIRVLGEKGEKSFEQTLLILTTSSLSEEVKTPWLSMYDVLDGSGEQVLWDSLKTVINPEQFEVLKREFVKFFSMEGIVSRLQFLNPAVVVREVELILMRYEKYYALEMSGHVRLNLYMHIAFMFERLMIAQDGYEEEQRELSEQEKEFYRISRIVFAEAEKKYRIRLDEYELSMLYELFKRLIK